jgi:acetyl-CoA acetyltransferase
VRFERSYMPLNCIWSSPFTRWQGSLPDVSSIDLITTVAADVLVSRGIDATQLTQLVLGQTIPQIHSFYGVPYIASKLGAKRAVGPLISQACATSVAVIAHAARTVEDDLAAKVLVLTTDRTSNGPLMIFPSGSSPGGAPRSIHWVLDSFAADPTTGESMVATADHVARDGGISRAAIDELTLLRFEQYQRSLADDRSFQRRYMQPIVLKGKKGSVQEILADEGVRNYSKESLGKIPPTLPGGQVTYATQTHPADGCAGTFVSGKEAAVELAKGEGVVRLVSCAFARAEQGRMPKAATLAACRAVSEASLKFTDLAAVTTHNPFAVNDLWFTQQTGYPLEKMNSYGCSLIFGHPQGPTGMRSIAELAHELQLRGGGYGLFTGCAAGDVGAALVIGVLTS